jgi:hypothetical protein
MKFFIFLFTLLSTSNGFSIPSFFKYWHCVGIKYNIDYSKPYKYNVGELPLVLWKDKKGNLISTVNICKHMGEKMDKGTVIDGCLQCPYHGVQHTKNDKFGETIVHEDKIFWSYEPIKSIPTKIPGFDFYNFEHSIVQMDIDTAMQDCIFNTIDLNNHKFTHNGIFGFGTSNMIIKNVNTFKYEDRVGIYFKYIAKKTIKLFQKYEQETDNQNVFVYPSSGWYKVTTNSVNKLIVGFNFLPISQNKTRLFITILKNHYKATSFEKEIFTFLTKQILNQNKMKNNQLKKSLIFKKYLQNDDAIWLVKENMKQYKYPNIDECVKLYDYHFNKRNIKTQNISTS